MLFPFDKRITGINEHNMVEVPAYHWCAIWPCSFDLTSQTILYKVFIGGVN